MAAGGPGGVVKLALAYMLRLSGFAEQCRPIVCSGQDGDGKCRLGAGIARRAKDLPGLVASAGLVPALTFYMSKADEKSYKSFLCVLRGGEGGCAKCNGVKEDLGWSEKAGYAPVLALAALGLQELGHVGDVEDYKKLALGLLELSTSPSRALLAERQLLELLVEAKKLAEAFFHEEEEEGQ